ncbi:MAG: glutamate-5-semialdehyde dehydrogenase [Bacteriovoracaceae bacterium]|jgi:glutamate-5-semialdehyde dehydrogenase
MKEAKLACKAKLDFNKVSEEHRTNALKSIADSLKTNIDQIIKANEKDLFNAKELNVSTALLDRLKLNKERIMEMVSGVLSIASQNQVVGEITETQTREDGLIIEKQRIPLGVIGMIFESRPNVVIDCSCLAIKSGNCIILKGGKEANESNRILTEIVRKAIKEFIPEDVVQLIDSREDVASLLQQVGLVDVIIPRGGEKLINYVYENSKVPVIAHFKGLCHIFIDQSANLDNALKIIINAKTQRPGVCNAMETLLLHKELPQSFRDNLLSELIKKGTEIRVCENTIHSNSKVNVANDIDWDTEYLANILSIKTVENLEMAITHIQSHGTHHSEAIVSNDQESINQFLSQVDASSIMINASTRFNDGSEYGLGAELGISTTKLHAYGPMGAKEMTTLRYLVKGNGHIRG